MKKNLAPTTCSYSMKKETSSMYWSLLGVDDGCVLDLGSGMGGFALSKPDNVDLYGVERDLEVSSFSKGYVDIVQMEIGSENLPFESGKFSAVFARDILEHVNEPWVVVDELYRVLKPGGVFICSVPKPDPKVVWSDYTHVRGFTSQALCSLVENSGFTVKDIFLMSGYTLGAKYGFSMLLPKLGKIPFIRNLFDSYHCISIK
jgi:SAM-dependent methyltransferase